MTSGRVRMLIFFTGNHTGEMVCLGIKIPK